MCIFKKHHKLTYFADKQTTENGRRTTLYLGHTLSLSLCWLPQGKKLVFQYVHLLRCCFACEDAYCSCRYSNNTFYYYIFLLQWMQCNSYNFYRTLKMIVEAQPSITFRFDGMRSLRRKYHLWLINVDGHILSKSLLPAVCNHQPQSMFSYISYIPFSAV